MIERLQLPREQNGIAFTIGDQKRRNKIVEQVGQTEPIDEVEENNQEKEPMRTIQSFIYALIGNNELKDNQHEGRIVHDHDTIAIMHNTFNNVNVETNFSPVGVNKTPMESTSSLQSTDMGVDSQARVFEDFNMMENDLQSWSELQQTAHIEPANVLNGTIAAATNNLHNTITPAEIDHDWCAEVALSPIETIPTDTDHDWAQEVIFEQDHDWATGFFPSFI
ncbi:hypothetical protein Tco_0646509 [Tanacetum coccineum]